LVIVGKGPPTTSSNSNSSSSSSSGEAKSNSQQQHHSKGDPLRNKMGAGKDHSVLGGYFPIPVCDWCIGKLKKKDVMKVF